MANRLRTSNRVLKDAADEVVNNRETLGPDHLDTLGSMEKLAILYWNQGLPKDAEQLEVLVVEGRKTKLGADHPDTLIAMQNLVLTYEDQDRWDAVEQLVIQMVEARKMRLGAGHRDTVESMAKLASTYVEQGRWAAAREQEEKIVKIRKMELGSDHPDTLKSIANLATRLYMISDDEEIRLMSDLAEAAGDYEREMSLHPQRVCNTYEWLLKDKKFSDWCASKVPSLWVLAGPELGKSVLSRSLIVEGLATNLPRPTSITKSVCYFFFRRGGDGPMDSAHALCALLHQLFCYSSRLRKYAFKSYEKYGATLTRKFCELWQILLSCAMSSEVGEIICVIDGLDICEENSRREFTEALKEFYGNQQSSPASRLKFFITSCPFTGLQLSLQNFFPNTACIVFDSEQIQQDINLVIDAEVPNITRGFAAKEDQEVVSEQLKILAGNQGTYFWPHVVFTIKEKMPSAYSRRPDMIALFAKLAGYKLGKDTRLLWISDSQITLYSAGSQELITYRN